MVEQLKQGDRLVREDFAAPVPKDIACEYSSVLSVILDLAAAKSESELNGLLHRIAESFGCSYFCYLGVFAIDSRDSILKNLSNQPTPVASTNPIHSEFLRVLIGCARTQLTPFVWSETHSIPPIRYGGQELHKLAVLLTIDDGFSFPIHDSMGNSGVLSFAAGTRSLSASFHQFLAYGLLTAVFAHDAMRRLVNKSAKVLEKPLTARETECLRLIAIGKSTWEMSKILGLSQDGVLHHVRSLMSKFGVHHRHQAVIRATTCGLL